MPRDAKLIKSVPCFILLKFLLMFHFFVILVIYSMVRTDNVLEKGQFSWRHTYPLPDVLLLKIACTGNNTMRLQRKSDHSGKIHSQCQAVKYGISPTTKQTFMWMFYPGANKELANSGSGVVS